ncbi:F-box/LRR-repeat protein 5-like isoform X1 [Salmo salar]|uniref:F-box/LRR-repeat protein 5 n=2 Tax=Salmo salar TaxID=8030 RepID=A0A1S3PAS7_SALSA|nr:F-box/LRR-repeat protein 5-like isoform X1 [Salmo salar]|eukprot:XP_014024730.1 PREDICTED: F-box/LRR-repeat protein 5-like [Salmo salar]
MAPFPDEVDVFTGPHWRMKQLVGLYCEKLSQTNFSNNNDFRSFLQSLCATFKEFKMHEQIENEYIIGLLQQRSCTVYNVHSDNKLSEMLSLFEKGLRSVKSEYEQLNYARQLKERLEAFTQDFLPHMKEEEEVFQPMLMQYFTYEELKDLKKQVMAQHCSQQRWDCAAEVLKGLSLWSQAEELHKAFKYADHEKTDELEKELCSTHISQLPTEILLHLFRYLGPEDLCHCGQVSSAWSDLAKTGSLWRHLYPVRWARGDHYRGPPADLNQEPDEEWVNSLQDEGKAYQEWDEDADVDESDDTCEDSLAISSAQREKKLLNEMIQNLLPAVGSSVRSIVLAYSSTVSSKMVRQILSLCPNLTHLDLTQTDVTDSAFDSWSSLGSCLSLEHLDLSGCEKITDHTLKKLSIGLGYLASLTYSQKRSDRQAKLLKSPPPISLLDERSLRLTGASRQALIFKQHTGRRCSSPSRVWVLDPSELADIEDAAEWNRRGGVSTPEGRGFVATKPGGSCCCRRSRRRGLRTSYSTSYWQQQYGLGEACCGHSTCCTGEMALRTYGGLQCLSYTTRGSAGAEFWTKCSSGGQRCLELYNRTDQSDARRSLRFLSLSGCYRVTDLGLRVLSQRGGLPLLEHLNLSGCLLITEVGLQELVSACPALNDEHFYYCDNINGPHADTASGCQNLQCGFRACCRSGE